MQKVFAKQHTRDELTENSRLTDGLRECPAELRGHEHDHEDSEKTRHTQMFHQHLPFGAWLISGCRPEQSSCSQAKLGVRPPVWFHPVRSTLLRFVPVKFVSTKRVIVRRGLALRIDKDYSPAILLPSPTSRSSRRSPVRTRCRVLWERPARSASPTSLSSARRETRARLATGEGY